MARLIVCPSCEQLIAAHERICPLCNGAQPTRAPRIAPVLLGLALSGCPADDDEGETVTTNDSIDTAAAYGVPDTGFDETGPITATDGTSSGSEGSGSASSDGSSEGTDTAADTSGDSSGGSDGSSDGSSGSSGGSGG